jgi:hypothetical protein
MEETRGLGEMSARNIHRGVDRSRAQRGWHSRFRSHTHNCDMLCECVFSPYLSSSSSFVLFPFSCWTFSFVAAVCATFSPSLPSFHISRMGNSSSESRLKSITWPKNIRERDCRESSPFWVVLSSRAGNHFWYQHSVFVHFFLVSKCLVVGILFQQQNSQKDKQVYFFLWAQIELSTMLMGHQPRETFQRI